MSVSDSATALDPVTVSAGSTLGESFAAAGLTMTGPNAIVVARTDDGRLLDLSHMPDAELAVGIVSDGIRNPLAGGCLCTSNVGARQGVYR